MSRTPLLLLGAGGHCSDVLSVLEACAEFDPGAARSSIIVADEREPEAQRFVGRDVMVLHSFRFDVDEPTDFVATVGYPNARAGLVARATEHGLVPAEALIHPTSDVGFGTVVGPGSVIFGQVWLSAQVDVGVHSFVSYGSTIGHDTTIGDFVSVMPNATVSGSVTIDDGVLVGAGSVILEEVHIGSGARVGAGAVVTGDVPPGDTVVGTPARSVDTTRR